ncbi:MAG: 16S rRNA (cytidine(1402)-2'-O)-methyltransferase [Treponemataceae bacterium]
MSTLYIVATPIGNLGDITFRAIETLKNVDYIACEDTRHTLRLLVHFGIQKPLLSCRVQNESKAAEKIITLLKEGNNVAFVSDAGTPSISDPGSELVSLVREAGFTISPIPGASAFAAIVSVAGCGGKSILFDGFLSVKPGKRRKRLSFLLQSGFSIVLYESPFRITKLLQDIADINNERRIVIGRELSKLYEEILVGTASELLEAFSERTKILGEFVVLIHGEKNVHRFEQYTDTI